MKNKIDKTERLVQSPDGLRIEGEEKVSGHIFTWMRYVSYQPREKTKAE